MVTEWRDPIGAGDLGGDGDRTDGRDARAAAGTWAGQTAICCATGPSLTPEDVAYCRRRGRVVAINDAYRLAPWADVLYACDPSWWLEHEPHLADVTGAWWTMQHQHWTPARVARWPRMRYAAQGPVHGLASVPGQIAYGRNSGYQALGLAVLFGAARIILLGYDMGIDRGGRTHFFGHHRRRNVSPYHLFLAAFATVAEPLRARGVEVINCSTTSHLTMFPRAAVRDVL